MWFSMVFLLSYLTFFVKTSSLSFLTPSGKSFAFHNERKNAILTAYRFEFRRYKKTLINFMV
jgi:hypothetical protein